MEIKKEQFGKMPNGNEVLLFTLKNKNQTECKITNYGGIVVSWKVWDKNSLISDIITGYDDLNGYLNDQSYMGALIGRYGNRIANGKFILDGVEYILAKNDGSNHLHGGNKGFNKVIWNYSSEITNLGPSLKLSYVSKDKEEGYPGNIKIEVDYTLTDSNELKINYKAKTDKKTYINLTNHMYFNLNGFLSNIFNHYLQLNSNSYTPVNDNLIPTGETNGVKGTNFDFVDSKKMGHQIILNNGFDHNFIITKNKSNQLTWFARAYEPTTGIYLEGFSTEPGFQLYTANHFDGNICGKNGIKYKQYYAFCLEAQHFPDSPNNNHFPSTLLNPDEVYTQETIYKTTIK